MKRFFALVLALCCVSITCCADPGVCLCYRLYQYAAADNDLHPGSFPYDSMFIDLYLMDDFKTLYYCKNVFSNGKIESTGFASCVLSKQEDQYHFILPSGESMYFYYDDSGDFWLHMDGGSLRLYPCEQFRIQTDFISDDPLK